MASRIRRAAAAGDWREVAAIDREIGALLPQLARVTNWTRPDLGALDLLRKAHTEARRECASALERVDMRLAEHRERKGGWIAYAMNDPEGHA